MLIICLKGTIESQRHIIHFFELLNNIAILSCVYYKKLYLSQNSQHFSAKIIEEILASKVSSTSNNPAIKCQDCNKHIATLCFTRKKVQIDCYSFRVIDVL